jgi:hypothetical protein
MVELTSVNLADITPSVMDRAAQLLGATEHEQFLAIAPPSMKCAFHLVCKLLVVNARQHA